MILEILKLSGSVLTRTFLFQTHKSSAFETCAKPYKKRNEQGTNSHVATFRRRDAMRVQNPTIAFTSQRWECLTQTSCQVTSRHIMSCHVTSHHIATFWVQKNNVVTLLEIYEQRLDVGHERHDVAGF